jgi:hypothetical protein
MSGEFTPQAHAALDTRSMGLCEVCGGGTVTEHHHRRPRGSGGTKRPETSTASNGLAVCHDCHRLIESHRALALLLGWLVPQMGDPAQSPVLRRGVWVLLADDGAIQPERTAA